MVKSNMKINAEIIEASLKLKLKVGNKVTTIRKTFYKKKDKR